MGLEDSLSTIAYELSMHKGGQTEIALQPRGELLFPERYLQRVELENKNLVCAVH